MQKFLLMAVMSYGLQAEWTKDKTVYQADLSSRVYKKTNLVTRFLFSSFIPSVEDKPTLLQSFCRELDVKYEQYGWQKPRCKDLPWQLELVSKKRHPLLYLEFGQGENVTMFIGGVHPDEITPIHLSFSLIEHLLSLNHDSLLKNHRVIVAPLVNPDGFFIKRPIRTNGKVDLNRNFLTKDWYRDAQKGWLKHKNAANRYFPGEFPLSEIETLFQVWLIETFQPQKILSIHAPLGFLDYDGPLEMIFDGGSTSRDANKLVQVLSKEAEDYRVVDYSFYPGSLGSFAGHERAIPTITVELQTTDPRKVKDYWKKFSPAFLKTIQFVVHKELKEKMKASHLKSIQSYYPPS